VKPVKQDSVPVPQSVPEASSPAKDTSIEDLKQEPDELLDNSDEELGILSNMIQTAQFHHPHPRSFQVRRINSDNMFVVKVAGTGAIMLDIW